jgi:N-acetylglucosamine-6-phosphate deacetylase
VPGLLIVYEDPAPQGNPTGLCWVTCEDGLIKDKQRGAAPSLASLGPATYTQIQLPAGCQPFPGFIDVHVHGAVGADTMDASPEGLTRMARFYARHGVTSFLPTTMTQSHDRIMAALRVVRDLMGQPTGGARIAGAHLEGPYINVKLIGAQNPAFVRTATAVETRELLDLGVIQRITLAPEFPENHSLIQAAASQGIAVSAGHTQAGPDELKAAIALGLRFTTHTFNAMVPLHHRNPGTVGAAMAFDELTCEIIPDLVHVHPVAIRALNNAKQGKVILITDAMAGAGMPDGQYDLGGLAVTVSGGRAQLSEGTPGAGTLAGSIATMDAGVRNFASATGQPLRNVAAAQARFHTAPAHPNTRNTGAINPGKDADIVVLDPDGIVQMTIVRGEVVYDRSGTHGSA